MNRMTTEQSDINMASTAREHATEQPDAGTFATEQSDCSVRSHSHTRSFIVAAESFFDARNSSTSNALRARELISEIKKMLSAVRVLDENLLGSGTSPRDDFDTAILAYTDHLRELRDYLERKLEHDNHRDMQEHLG